MSFGALYDHVQTCRPPISRTDVRLKLRELLPDKPFRVISSGLDISRLRGYYVSARNLDCRFVQQAGGANVIVIARDQSDPWKRVIEFKELMHLFDDPLESTNSGEDLEILLSGLCETVEDTRSPQLQSEIDCIWMALALCCPEERRAELQQRRDERALGDADVAAELQIPESWVSGLFHPSYKENIFALLSKSRR